MIKMQEIADMGHNGILFQCPECKTVIVLKNRIPECDCDNKSVEEFFGKDYRKNENYKEVMAKRISKTFV